MRALLFTLLLATLSFAQTGCQDYGYWSTEGWRDASDNTCSWYGADVDARCGLENGGTDGYFARQACCACNGGSTSQCDADLSQTWVTLTVCDSSVSADASTSDPPVVQVCDNENNCAETAVTAEELAMGASTTVVVDVSSLPNAPTVARIQADTGDDGTDGKDGLCLSSFKVNWVEGTSTYPAWIDAECDTVDKPCDCGYYTLSTAHIWTTCQETEGVSTLELQNDDENLIIVFSENMMNVDISMTAEVDMDLRLYSGPDNHPTCNSLYTSANCPVGGDECQVNPLKSAECSGKIIVGYGGTFAVAGTHSYNGMQIEFSGDRTQTPVTEFIKIDKTLEVMALYVYSLGEGEGDVTYKWSGVEPCEENFGCTPCEDWACKPPNLPVCDGQHGGCTTPGVANPLEAQQEERAQCDSKQTNCGTSVSTAVPECIDWPLLVVETTTSPTSVPSTSPTSVPSKSPTSGPTDSPSSTPLTSEPTPDPTTWVPPETCPENTCNDHGVMEDQDHRDGCKCVCDEGYYGDNCEYTNCVCGEVTVVKGRFTDRR